MIRTELQGLLVCPGCRGALAPAGAGLRCQSCAEAYRLHGGTPALIPPDSPLRDEFDPDGRGRPEDRARTGWRRVLRRCLDHNPLTLWSDKSLFRHLNECGPRALVLNLGSGAGHVPEHLAPHLRLINLDISVSCAPDVVADAHFLPFADESLDAVFCNDVLEHVQRPWRVAEEIYRVLRPGGRAFVGVPFIYPIHDAHDYFRFTDKGLESLFCRFRKIAGGVSSGPSSSFGPFVIEYLLCFVPGRYPRAAARRLLTWSAWPVKYADLIIRRSERFRVAACGFYFVGQK